jgi:hypothetical protein
LTAGVLQQQVAVDSGQSHRVWSLDGGCSVRSIPSLGFASRTSIFRSQTVPSPVVASIHEGRTLQRSMSLWPWQDHSLRYPHQTREEGQQLLPLSGLPLPRLQVRKEAVTGHLLHVFLEHSVVVTLVTDKRKLQLQSRWPREQHLCHQVTLS